MHGVGERVANRTCFIHVLGSAKLAASGWLTVADVLRVGEISQWRGQTSGIADSANGREIFMTETEPLSASFGYLGDERERRLPEKRNRPL
ncbi:hypothetical protein MRX96_056131 [Rhipicephalus microplus]